jgi:hypothetical protein
MANVKKALASPNRFVTSLNFKFSFLNDKHIYYLWKGLELSRSIVKLDLSSNGLPPVSGIKLMKALHVFFSWKIWLIFLGQFVLE